MSCRENESQNGSNPGKANRADKRIQWSEESMTGAIKAVVKGSSISGAAREHGVPRTTLQDQGSWKSNSWHQATNFCCTFSQVKHVYKFILFIVHM